MSNAVDEISPGMAGLHAVEAAIAESAWPDHVRPDRLGVEAEALPLRVSAGRPLRRLHLRSGRPSVLEIMEETAGTGSEILSGSRELLTYPTTFGGRVTFEPGAQIEHSTAASPTAGQVAFELESVWNLLRDRFWSHGVCLLSLGVDPWNDVQAVPQQLPQTRYRAMAIYFAARGTAGAVMMRNTCSLQVNLDAGTGATRKERWLAANLMSPLLTAMFASSPGVGARSQRSLVWQALDPTRTGLPAWSSVESADPLGDTLKRALDAQVMFVTRGNVTVPGSKGWTLRRWLDEGHATLGPPTRSDLETHLTTIFTEVRPRNGTLELRGIDGLPPRYWDVPLVVAGALLYDPESRRRLIDLLSPFASRLSWLWHRAATQGLTDPVLRSLGERVAHLSLEAAGRDQTRFGFEQVRSAQGYLEGYTLQGRCPADDLAPLLHDPGAALAWAAPEHAMRGAA